VSVLGAALAGRRLRLSVGLVVAMLLAVNALAGPGSGGTEDEPGQVVAGATARAEAPNSSPTVAPTGGTAAGTPAPTGAAEATPAPTDPAGKPPTETGAPPPSVTEAPDPTTAPTIAATPTPPRTPVVLEGSGSAVTGPIDYPEGSVRILSRAIAGSGGCAYIGTFASTDPANVPADPSLRTAVIFLEGSGSDEGWVDLVLPAGRYFMEIESDCSWIVTVSPT
jgi:hypothetical protein